jgi:hypothetical protein
VTASESSKGVARIARPAFQRPPLDPFVNEMVDRITDFHH